MISSYRPNCRQFIKTLGLGMLTLGLTGCAGSMRLGAGTSRRPNILFLFTDDQRFSTLHALNNPEVQTPNMDLLEQMYVPMFDQRQIFHVTNMSQKLPKTA